VKHHSSLIRILTPRCKPAGGQCVQVSLTGAVSSQMVTEERKAWLSMVGNYALRVWLEARLTVRPTSRAGTKVGPNDPTF
jgi:hypothetical protein